MANTQIYGSKGKLPNIPAGIFEFLNFFMLHLFCVFLINNCAETYTLNFVINSDAQRSCFTQFSMGTNFQKLLEI